jgi:CHAD domain-containing protein
LANASVMADADLAEAVAADAEYLHQLRVGLRRLRSLLGVFGPLAPQEDVGLAAALGTLFGQLGAARDRDAMAEWLWPALLAADAPWVPGRGGDSGAASTTTSFFDTTNDPATAATTAATATTATAVDDGVDIGALLRAPATQQLWLSALAACQPPRNLAAALPLQSEGTPAVSGGHKGPKSPMGQKGQKGASRLKAPDAVQADPLREVLRAPLHRLFRQVRRDASRFAELDDEARHRLRRRIKRLRYAADAAASLWPAKAVDDTLRALARAQQPLGDYNDTVVALALMRGLALQDGRAWFAVGWLTARRESLAAPCAKALKRLSRVRGFWR